MAELLGSTAEVSANGAYPSFPAGPSVSEVAPSEEDSKAGIIKAEPTTSVASTSAPADSGGDRMSPSEKGGGSNSSSGGGDGVIGSDRGGFSLGRTMSVLQANQEGFDEFYY